MKSNLCDRWSNSRWLAFRISTLFTMVALPWVVITQDWSFCATIFYASAVVRKNSWAANWLDDEIQISWKLKSKKWSCRSRINLFVFWHYLPAHLLTWTLVKILTTLAPFRGVPLLLAAKSSTYLTSKIIRMKHFWNIELFTSNNKNT